VPATSGIPVTADQSQSAAQAAAIDVLAAAIYGLQRQVYQLAAGMSGGGGPASFGPYTGAGSSAPYPLLGMPGYGVVSSAPFTAAVVVHTAAASQRVPITYIQFPPSSSPIPGYSEMPPLYQQPHRPLPYQGAPPQHPLVFLKTTKPSAFPATTSSPFPPSMAPKIPWAGSIDATGSSGRSAPGRETRSASHLST
jgi:hypothetical protein